jgi:hypothetical protein
MVLPFYEIRESIITTLATWVFAIGPDLRDSAILNAYQKPATVMAAGRGPADSFPDLNIPFVGTVSSHFSSFLLYITSLYQYITI